MFWIINKRNKCCQKQVVNRIRHLLKVLFSRLAQVISVRDRLSRIWWIVFQMFWCRQIFLMDQIIHIEQLIDSSCWIKRIVVILIYFFINRPQQQSVRQVQMGKYQLSQTVAHAKSKDLWRWRRVHKENFLCFDYNHYLFKIFMN